MTTPTRHLSIILIIAFLLTVWFTQIVPQASTQDSLERRVAWLEHRVNLLETDLDSQGASLRILMKDYADRQRTKAGDHQ